MSKPRKCLDCPIVISAAEHPHRQRCHTCAKKHLAAYMRAYRENYRRRAEARA